MKYDHQSIEKKWQGRWHATRLFEVTEDPARKREKSYVLDMFPYPSAAGLHVGHPIGYIATDIIARKRRMEGRHVLHPMGWDAFGLPAENFAIKTGVHPRKTTEDAIARYQSQLQMLGLSYDWSREVNTSDPSYYRWTQWLFLLLYKNDLAYRASAPVNWCPSCQTVLANEQVIEGTCERCQNPVVQKELEQWFFRITQYIQRLLLDIEKIDWPEKIKLMQQNWIGKSEGVEINFKGVRAEPFAETQKGTFAIKEKEFDMPVFTTRADTLFGVTYVVLAPEHPLVMELVADTEREAVMRYIEESRRKTELERTGLEQEKIGVPIGAAAIHPLTGEKVPIWIADYVLMGYGTGAVMGVPAHDERDFVFAKKYGLPIRYVVAPPHDVSEAKHEEVHHGQLTVHSSQFRGAYTGPGHLVNSGEFTGLTSEDAKQKIADMLEAQGRGRRQTNYHLRDWLVSRQRYWGAPIPIIYCETCGMQPVPLEDLPVLLPDDVDFRPTGESPLVRSKSFHNVTCPKCGAKARRESDTMDTFVDSVWYFLRYPDPQNDKRFATSDKLRYWCPVDLYVGGAEHAVLHLLYARFFTKVLYDLGHLHFEEPFLKLRNQGLILGEDGQKMSKSRGNVVNPDDVVLEYGADALRVYEMFMGDFEEAKPWSTESIRGVRRFLERVYGIKEKIVLEPGLRATGKEPITQNPPFDPARDREISRMIHKTVKKVTEDIEAFKFNTAIAQMMICVNAMVDTPSIPQEIFEFLIKVLSPFAPHLTEELWEALGHRESIQKEKWPTYDPELVRDSEIELVIQVDGKVRDRITVPADLTEDELKAHALASEKIKARLHDKKIAQVIVARGKLVNVVTQ